MLAAYFILGAKTLEQVLLQTNGRFAAVHGFPIVAVAGGAGGGVVRAFTAITAQQVDFRQVAAFGCVDLVVSSNARIDTRLDLRMDFHRFLHRLCQGLSLYETGG